MHSVVHRLDNTAVYCWYVIGRIMQFMANIKVGVQIYHIFTVNSESVSLRDALGRKIPM
jgi:hypothetical protein